jgi:hypothetical protein
MQGMRAKVHEEGIVSIADPFEDISVRISSAIFAHEKKP